MFLEILNKIHDLEEIDNKVLSASVVSIIYDSGQTTFSELLELLLLEKNEVENIVNNLIDSDILVKDGVFLTISTSFLITSKEIQAKTHQGNIVLNKENLQMISHLEELTGKTFSASSYSYKINSLRSKGISDDDFKTVNSYFFLLWNNPKMFKYLNPGVLYDSKFEERLDEARTYFSTISYHKNSINNIINKFSSLYMKHFNIQYIFTIEDSEAIAWILNNNESEEEILKFIDGLFSIWGMDIKNLPYMKLSYIFNEKYMQRKIDVFSKINLSTKYDCLTKYISSIKNTPDKAIISSYEEFFDNNIDYIDILCKTASNMSYYDEYAYINIVSLTNFIEYLKKEIENDLYLFLESMYRHPGNYYNLLSPIREKFINWCGGLDFFENLILDTAKTYVKSFIINLKL